MEFPFYFLFFFCVLSHSSRVGNAQEANTYLRMSCAEVGKDDEAMGQQSLRDGVEEWLQSLLSRKDEIHRNRWFWRSDGELVLAHSFLVASSFLISKQ